MNKHEIIMWLKFFERHPYSFIMQEENGKEIKINMYAVFNYLLGLQCAIEGCGAYLIERGK